MTKTAALLSAFLWLGVANAHLAAWHKGMYCLDGNTGSVDLNSAAIVTPLYQLPFSGWWFHAYNGCNNFPPANGDVLDLPAGGSFQVEIASNRAKTSLSYGGQYTSEWPDGSTYPEDYNVPTCITSPNMHTQNQSQAAGTAFAISYHSDISAVTPENLVVFTVRYNTPWKRIVNYDVPAAMPACPSGGCICAWGWVPNGCGQPNMYHTAFKCQVTGATSTTPLATPKAPVWCEGDPSACTKGAKQMIYWNQDESNNIVVSGSDLAGEPKSPAYNSKLGFPDGAQNDIFSGAASSSSGSSGSSSSGASSGTSSAGNSSGSKSSAIPSAASSAAVATGTSSGTNTAGNASSASSAAAASTGIPNAAPSCRKRVRKRDTDDHGLSLVKKSALVHEGVVSHKRHSRSRVMW